MMLLGFAGQHHEVSREVKAGTDCGLIQSYQA